MNAALRIVVIEDSAPLRAYLCHLLGELEGVEVVAEASDEQGAIRALAQRECDLAIVDLELASGSGLGVLGQVQAQPERFGTPRRVVYSSHDHAAIRDRCVALGAERFFDKRRDTGELLDFVAAARLMS